MSAARAGAEGWPVDDEWLVRQVLHGKAAYWGALVRRYRTPLVNWCQSILGSGEAAEDMADEVLRKAHDSLQEFLPWWKKRSSPPLVPRTGKPCTFLQWLHRIAFEPLIEKKRGLR